MDRKDIDSLLIAAFKRVKGIMDACPLLDRHRKQVLEIEQDAENRSLMGLGKVVNTGVRRVLEDELVYVLLTDMAFEWEGHSTLVLKKGETIVGRDVRDQDEIERLSGCKDVWFMHRNFVVFKDKLAFPKDIMQKICHFEIPGFEPDWRSPPEAHLKYRSTMLANPATPSDVFLKEQYFDGVAERGLGTGLVGIELITGAR